MGVRERKAALSTHDDVHEHTRRQPSPIVGDDGAPAQVVTAIRDVADAIRDLADHAPADPHQLLRAEEVAQLLQLPVRTVRDRAAAGAIPHRRFGKHYRFSLADVEQIIQSMERTPRQHRGPLRAAA